MQAIGPAHQSQSRRGAAGATRTNHSVAGRGWSHADQAQSRRARLEPRVPSAESQGRGWRHADQSLSRRAPMAYRQLLTAHC
jgi:hypothetical protein